MKAERLVRVLRRKQEDAIQKFRNCARGVVQAYCQLHEHKFIRGEGVPTAHTSSFDAPVTNVDGATAFAALSSCDASTSASSRSGVIGATSLELHPGEEIPLPLPVIDASAELSDDHVESALQIWDFLNTFGGMRAEDGFQDFSVSSASTFSSVNDLCLSILRVGEELGNEDSSAISDSEGGGGGGGGGGKRTSADFTILAVSLVECLLPGLFEALGEFWTPAVKAVLPVNHFTWQELARRIFLVRAYRDIGVSPLLQQVFRNRSLMQSIFLL